MRLPPAFILRVHGPGMRRLACALALVVPVTATVAAPPASTGRTIVDHAVVPAGGGCRNCGSGQCRDCKVAHHRHHAACRSGLCHPHCPVRPQEFGFYETNWRRWPGSGVVATSNLEAVTPAVPPKSEVPTADEESATLPAAEAPIPDEGAAFRRQVPAAPSPTPPPSRPAETLPPVGPSAQPRPAPAPQPPATARPQPPAQPPVAPKPTVQPQPSTQPKPAAKPRPEAEKDLFDESRLRPGTLRRLAVSGGTPLGEPIPRPRSADQRIATARPSAAIVQSAALQLPQPPEPPPLTPSRVPFDAAAEATRMRQLQKPRR